ncbi:hypothetical protein [Pseudanabaena minima]
MSITHLLCLCDRYLEIFAIAYIHLHELARRSLQRNQKIVN